MENDFGMVGKELESRGENGRVGMTRRKEKKEEKKEIWHPGG